MKLPKLRAVRVNGTATHYSLVNDATGGLIADAYYRADEIVSACNSHDALVATLRKICDAEDGIAVINAIAEARALIKEGP